MSTKHTPEPWKVEMENFIVGSNQETICQFFYKDESDKKNNNANAQRIVACVNACKGVSNQWLWENSVQARIEEIAGLKKIVHQDIDAMAEMQAKHEQLFAEVKKMRDLQVKFFKTRDKQVMRDSIAAEKVVDKLLNQ